MKHSFSLRPRAMKQLLAVILLTTVSACSSSSSRDADESADDLNLPTDASTDAVPAPSPEEQITLSEEPVFAEAMPETSSEKASPSFRGSGKYITYRVQKGDTLMKIAYQFYGDLYLWKRIYEGNRKKIASANNIPPGTRIRLEKPAEEFLDPQTGEKRRIQQGETLGDISRDVYGTTRKWKRLWEQNRRLIKNPNHIYAGFFLYYTLTERDQQEKETRFKNGPILGKKKRKKNGSKSSVGVQIESPVRLPASKK